MPKREGRIDDLFAQLPALFNARENSNWRAIIEAVGGVDDDTLNLIEAVREQFFIKTASRPYLDRLGTANLVQRPRFVGMDDTTFRDFIPVMSYQPKQVKIIFDKLLDLFFFKESTTSFANTIASEPFALRDGWELEYEIDSFSTERIEFRAEEFTDITNATANEVVAAINRQSSSSYAIAFENSVTREVTIQIFTNTIGAKGSVEVTGGRANIGLQFDGFNSVAGNGALTEWEITKVGDTATLRYTGLGGTPNIEALKAGDVVIIQRENNSGSFVIDKVDATNDFITYKNLFATPETFVEDDPDVVKFMTPIKTSVFLKDRRALVWQVRPGEIVVEIPPSPPVVKRKRSGAAHINGIDTVALSLTSDTITLKNSDKFPEDGGKFYFIPKGEIHTYYPNDNETGVYNFNNRLSTDIPLYEYTSKVGDTLIGITPELPKIATTEILNLASSSRDNDNTITATTTTEHDYKLGEYIIFEDNGTSALNGTWKITEIVDSFTFKLYSFGGPFGALGGSGGTTRVERLGISDSSGRVLLTSAQIDPQRQGPYMWDQDADFVLSSLTTNVTAEIPAGSTQRSIQVESNDIPSEEGRLIFDFGTEKQEGPVRYLFKPNEFSIALDPSYVFKNKHDVGSAVTMIRRRGGIEFSGSASEFPAYITDPAAAREVLQELMQEIKSVGIFINFLIRYPEQYYATIDVYKSGIDPG